jgi:hypothetical protein
MGRLLMTIAAAVALGGVAATGGSHYAGRFVGLSGFLVMVGLALLLLAPRPATRDERRVRVERLSASDPVGAEFRVPTQRSTQQPEDARAA